VTPEPALLRRLELTVLRRVDGLLQGDFQGLLPAQGWEAGDARPYAVGDDVRRIDWTVTARTGEPHVRTTIADRELEVTFVVDLSSSMAFGTGKMEKHELGLSAVGTLGLVAVRSGNRVGALIDRGGRTTVIPARGGREHLYRILRGMIEPARDLAAVELDDLLRRAGRVAVRRGLVVVVSDFLDGTDWIRPLRVLADRHTVMAVEIVDPRELELPPVGVLAVVDPETGVRRRIDTNSPKLRARFRAAAEEQRRNAVEAFGRAGVRHLIVRTDEDWVPSLVRQMEEERRRLRVGAPR
jgi:uncharacterized protein (DUF58 family)